ncbi:MAG TPA: hypothetical protein VHS31_04645 [Tepidisphaeraceae bacterium]|nr:hypothetical protein [Tepidisphaeraceae bacterium]
MSTSNELIAVIDSNRNSDASVKAIRKQKYAPSDFYLTLTSGRQVGPVKCAGDQSELDRKFVEAEAYLAGLKGQAGLRKAA